MWLGRSASLRVRSSKFVFVGVFCLREFIHEVKNAVFGERSECLLAGPARIEQYVIIVV